VPVLLAVPCVGDLERVASGCAERKVRRTYSEIEIPVGRVSRRVRRRLDACTR
jgi:predicted transcriptional regulator